MKIEKINYGIAFTVEDKGKKYIQVNKKLYNYPNLLKDTLEHEKKHLRAKGIYNNILIDLKDQADFKTNIKYLKFYLKHPSAFLSFSPFLYENNKWIVLPFNLALWLVIILIVSCSILIISFDKYFLYFL